MRPNARTLIAKSVLILAFIAAVRPVQAEVKPTLVHVFGSMRCRACVEAKAYLEYVSGQEKAAVSFHDVSSGPEAAALAKAVARKLQLPISDFPLVVVGDRGFVGWSDDMQGPNAVAAIRALQSQPASDVVAVTQAEITAKDAVDAEDEKEGPGFFLPAMIVFLVAVATAAAVLSGRRGAPSLPLGGR